MSRSALIRRRQSEVRALQKEYHELRLAYYYREWIKLDKPIRNGWCKHLKIKEAIAETKYGELYQTICDLVTIKVGGTLKEDCRKRWDRQLKNDPHIRLPGIRGISQRDMKQLPVAARKYFQYYGYSHGCYGEKAFMCMLSQSYFEEVYSRAYITHRRPVDAEAVKRMDEIDELLLTDKYFNHSWNAYSWNYGNRHHCKIERRIIRMELDEVIRTQNEDLTTDYTFIESTYR